MNLALKTSQQPTSWSVDILKVDTEPITKNMDYNYIKINNIQSSENKVVVKLDISEKIRKFFLSTEFSVEYGIKIKDIDESILVIPVISTIMPIAWATGANVYVEDLDKSYLDYLNEIEQTFRGMFSLFSFSGKIFVQNVVSNKFSNKGYALLFSGGVDSLASYIRNKDNKPTLISIWGADIPLHEPEFWNNVSQRLLNFAETEGVEINFVKSNIQEIPNSGLLTNDYKVESWWGSVSHGLILLGLCAPLTVEKIGTIFSASPGKGIVDGTNILFDKSITWADVKNVHDSSEISRQEKIKILKNYPQCLSYLRVCWRQHFEYNCGYCEKCLRTIVGLLLEDIDPKICNFEIKNNILDLMQIYLDRGILDLTENEIVMWRDIQQKIPIEMEDTEVSRRYESEKFFRWFKNFDLSNYKHNTSKITTIISYFYLLKYTGIHNTSRTIHNIISSLYSQTFAPSKKILSLENKKK